MACPQTPEIAPSGRLRVSAKRFYNGLLAHKVAQANGTVKDQDKQATPAHDRTTGQCNIVAKKKALRGFSKLERMTDRRSVLQKINNSRRRARRPCSRLCPASFLYKREITIAE